MVTSQYNNIKFETKVDFGYCDYQVDLSKKIIYITFKKDVLFTLEMGKELFYKCYDFFPTERIHVIINITDKTEIQANSLDFIASEERTKKIISDAFIIKSPTLKMVSNFYLRIKKPKIKTKVFTAVEEAFAWSQEQMDV